MPAEPPAGGLLPLSRLRGPFRMRDSRPHATDPELRYARMPQPESILARIDAPSDLRRLDPEELERLAAEIRQFILKHVSRTGGHLSPNLGVVELTLALHRVFDSPRDRLIWDVGHQTYVHKLVTGRRGEFDKLRKFGGLSGYPSREESPHDVVENSHASTSLSDALGHALAGDAGWAV